MRYFRLLIMVFLLSDMVNLSGQSPLDLPPSRFDYYVFFNDELKDIRDFSTVIESIPAASAKAIGRDSFLVCRYSGSYNSGECKSYDHRNRLISSFTVPGFLASDYRYTIELKEGDLWISMINPVTGSLSGKRQLTQLGIFDRYFRWQHWYKDLIVFMENSVGNQYILNVNSGEITNLTELVGITDNKRVIPIAGREDDQYDSPDGRFALTHITPSGRSSKGISFYDFEKQVFMPNVFKPHLYVWLDNSHLLHNPVEEEGEPMEIIDLQNPGQKEALITLHQRPIVFPKSRKELSLNHRYLCSLENLLDPNRNICTITDLVSGEIKEWESNISLLVSSMGLVNDFLPFRWISDHHLIYVKQGDLLQQGTWLYDAESNRKTRITPYKADEGFTVLEKVGMVLFYANNTLYRYDLNGSRFDPLLENARIQTLLPFRFQ